MPQLKSACACAKPFEPVQFELERMHLSLHGTVHVALPPAEALSLFTPQGECEWVPDWNPTFPGGEATDEPGTTFVTQHRGSPTLWVIADRTESSMRYARVRPGLHAGMVEVRCEPDESEAETRVEVTYDLTALGDNDAVARFGSRFDAMLTHWEHLIAVALAARVA
jgi:hypothetical protein